MGSRGTLWGLALFAGVVGGVLGIDLFRDDSAAALDRRMVPELSDHDVTAITIEPDDSPRIRLVRGEDGRLSIVEPVATLVSADAEDELIFTLRRLSYRRREGGRISDPRATVTLELGDDRLAIEIGARIEPTGQVWIGRSDRPSSYVVDGYAIDVLLRGVDHLRERSVWSNSPRRASRIELRAESARVAFAGAVAQVGGVEARADPGALVRIASMLDRLRFESFQSPMPAVDGGLRVRVHGEDGVQELSELGACTPTLVLVVAPVGTGCVDRATLDSLRETALAGRALWDRDLFGGSDLESIDVSAGPRRASVEAHRPQARQWIARLRAAVKPEWIETPGVDPVATASLSARDGSIRHIDIYRGPIAARRGEPVALRLDLGVAELLEPGPNLFRARALIERDASEVARIAVGSGPVAVRGQLVDEWKADGPETTRVDGVAVSAAARSLAQLSAVEFIDGELSRPVRTIEFDLDATPTGEPATTQTLRIDPKCRATLDADATVFIVPEALCSTLLATWWD